MEHSTGQTSASISHTVDADSSIDAWKQLDPIAEAHDEGRWTVLWNSFAIFCMLLIAASAVGLVAQQIASERQKVTHAEGLVQTILNAELKLVPSLIDKLDGHRTLVDPLLRQANSAAAQDSREKLNTSLALLPSDPEQAEYLFERMLDTNPEEFVILRAALKPYRTQFIERLNRVFDTDKESSRQQRLCAGAALFEYGLHHLPVDREESSKQVTSLDALPTSTEPSISTTACVALTLF